MAATPLPSRRRRRRARRGSLERPVSARLYRASFLILALPLLVLAFGDRAARIAAGAAAAGELRRRGRASRSPSTSRPSPDRPRDRPGASRRPRGSATRCSQYDLPSTRTPGRSMCPGSGTCRSQNLWAVAAGQSPDAIVVMAHRDDTGVGPGANDNASGTAALIELARGYARADVGACAPAHTIVFLSTDGGAFGGLGAERFARAPAVPRRRGRSTSPRSRAAASARRDRRRQRRDRPRPAWSRRRRSASSSRPGVRVRPRRLPRPARRPRVPVHALRAGAVRRPRHPARHADDRGRRGRPRRSTDQRRRRSTVERTHARSAAPRRSSSARSTRASTSRRGRPLRVGRRPHRARLGDRAPARRGCSIPFVVAVVDLFARCRRRHVSLLPALRQLRSRLFFWLFAGRRLLRLRLARRLAERGAPSAEPGVARGGRLAGARAVALVVVLAFGWLVGRQRLVPRRPVSDEERLAGDAAALLGLCLVALLILATNPFALIFVLPALHAWLWLPQVRLGARPAPAGSSLLVGLLGPAIVLLLSLATRFGSGSTHRGISLELVARRLRARAGGGDHAGRRRLRGPAGGGRRSVATRPTRPGRAARRGPLRELVRTVVLTDARRPRRRTEEAAPPERSRGVMRRALPGLLGTLLIAGGSPHASVWVLVVWRWQDPFTAIYTHIQQTRLAHAYERQAAAFHPKLAGRDLASVQASLAADARAYGKVLHRGGPVGRITIGRIGLKMIVVQGTDHGRLEKGPGSLHRQRPAGRGSPDLRRRATARRTSRRSRTSTTSAPVTTSACRSRTARSPTA